MSDIDRSEALRLAREALEHTLTGAMCQDRIIGRVADAIEKAAEGGKWYGETAEREACAKIADECSKTPAQIGPLFNAGISAASEHIASAIRARGSA